MKELHREADQLRAKANDLASFNYAREPEFAHDRNILRETLQEVLPLKRDVTNKYLHPVIEKLNKLQDQLTSEEKKYEHQCDFLAEEFLAGVKDVDLFLDEYIKSRQQFYRHRALAENLKKKVSTSPTKSSTINHEPPIAMPRQRKRLSLNKI